MEYVMTYQSPFASSSSLFSRKPLLIARLGSGTVATAPAILRFPNYFRDAIRCSLTVSHKATGRGLSYKRIGNVRCLSALSPELQTTLDKVVTSQKVILFMKGTKEFPQCGFSNTVVQILKSLNVPFETINILENEMLRQGLKEYSNWPTFPQLYIGGEFFGGCDITAEAYKSGQLQELIEKELCS